MNFLELAKKRKTTYVFSERDLTSNSINKILEAARWAPSSGNNQPWRFIVVNDKKRIHALMDLCHYHYFHTPPNVMIALVAEPLKQHGTEGLARLSDYHKYLNISLPALNMCYQATELGIGSCILSPVNDDANKILKVPKNRKVPLIVGLGYEKGGATTHKRKDISEIVSYESY